MTSWDDRGLDPDLATAIHRQKVTLITHALEAHELALKHQALGNYSNDYRATHISLKNGTTAMATNLELNEGKSTPCGERSAVIAAVNQAIRALPLARLQQASGSDIAMISEGLKANVLVMATSNLKDYAEVCSDCETWMADKKLFSPDTLFVSLGQTPHGAFSLRVQRLIDRMPRWGKQHPSVFTDGQTFETANVDPLLSKRAQQVLAAKPYLVSQVQPLLQQAKAEFDANRTAWAPERNTAAAVMLSSSTSTLPTLHRYAAPLFSWKRRWYEAPDLLAASWGYQDLTNRLQAQDVRIQAVAYYGNDSQFPLPTNLGRLAQATRGGLDTLVVVLEHNRIHVRTIADYLPRTSVSNGTPGSSNRSYA